MKLYQIIFISISSAMLLQAIYQFLSKKKGFSLLKILTQFFVWGGMLFLAIFPDKVITMLGHFLGIEDNFNALILVGFLVVFILFFKLLSLIEKVEKDITKIVRNNALDKLNNHNNYRKIINK